MTGQCSQIVPLHRFYDIQFDKMKTREGVLLRNNYFFRTTTFAVLLSISGIVAPTGAPI